jgi:hypothetical protein
MTYHFRMFFNNSRTPNLNESKPLDNDARERQMNCANCGYRNRRGVKFCENCGNPLSRTVKNDSIKSTRQTRSEASECPNCSFKNRTGVSFCENCGFAIGKQPISKLSTGKQICPECNTKNREEVLFCENCGSRLISDTKQKTRPVRWGYLMAFLALGALTFAAYSMGIFQNLGSVARSNEQPYSESSQGGEIPPKNEYSSSPDIFPIQSVQEAESRPPDLAANSPAQLFNQLSENSLVYRGGNNSAIYETDGFRYIYAENTWFAFDSRFESSETLFVLSIPVGEFQSVNGQYRFYSNGEDPAWVEEYFGNKSGVSRDGNEWVFNGLATLNEWLLEQSDEGALWSQDGGRFILLKTSDQDRLGSIAPARLARILNPGWGWTAIRVVAAAAGGATGGWVGGVAAVYVVSVVEKAWENDWAGGCGDATRSLIVPDSDLVTGILTMGVIDNFDTACGNHDSCYEDYYKTKEECDDAFYQELKDSCWEPTCKEFIASWYASAVRSNGDSFYEYEHASTGINGNIGIDPNQIEAGECAMITWSVNKFDPNLKVDVWLTGDLIMISGKQDPFSSSREVGENGSLEICPQTLGQFTVILSARSRSMELDIPYSLTITAPAGPPQVSVSQDTLCREGPGTSWNAIGDLQLGEVSEVVGLYDENYIVIENYGASGTCWLYTGYAQISGDTSGLPYWDTPEWEAWGEGTEEFEFMLWNSSSSDICDFYIASSSDNSWSSDLLPIAIGPGESYLFQIVDGHGSPYQIEIVTCDGFTFGDSGLDLGTYNDYEFFD